jgi:GTP-binding protein LepA
MRAVVQRVSEAFVEVEGEVVGRIGLGLLVLLGVGVIHAPEGSRVLARESIPLLLFNELAKSNSGDLTRKRKLLERQKEGKKRMNQVGRVEIPHDAFLAVLSIQK